MSILAEENTLSELWCNIFCFWVFVLTLPLHLYKWRCQKRHRLVQTLICLRWPMADRDSLAYGTEHPSYISYPALPAEYKRAAASLTVLIPSNSYLGIYKSLRTCRNVMSLLNVSAHRGIIGSEAAWKDGDNLDDQSKGKHPFRLGANSLVQILCPPGVESKEPFNEKETRLSSRPPAHV